MDDTHTTDGAAPQVRPVDLRDYVRADGDPAQRVRVFATDHLAVDLWCIDPQAATPVLDLPTEDVVYTVLGGRSWFVTDDGDVGLDPLGAVLIPAGVIHGIDNRAPDPLIVVAVSSPPSAQDEDPPVVRSDAAVRRDDEGPGPLRRAVDRLLGGTRPRE